MFDTIYLDNDYFVRYDVTAPDAATGEQTAAESLVLNVRLSRTRGGAAIDSSLNKTASELSGVPGGYTCVFEGSDLVTFLTGIHMVWVVVQAGVGDILCSNLVSVRATRAAA